jgi:GAF domain-containing protein
MNALQNLVRLATQLCSAPFGVVIIISAVHQHQIGTWGVDPGVCSREDSMCAKVFLSRKKKTVVADASLDLRFADSPFVTGELGKVRFYASVPLVTAAGVCAGHPVCLLGNRPRAEPRPVGYVGGPGQAGS